MVGIKCHCRIFIVLIRNYLLPEYQSLLFLIFIAKIKFVTIVLLIYAKIERKIVSVHAISGDVE